MLVKYLFWVFQGDATGGVCCDEEGSLRMGLGETPTPCM